MSVPPRAGFAVQSLQVATNFGQSLKLSDTQADGSAPSISAASAPSAVTAAVSPAAALPPKPSLPIAIITTPATPSDSSLRTITPKFAKSSHDITSSSLPSPIPTSFLAQAKVSSSNGADGLPPIIGHPLVVVPARNSTAHLELPSDTLHTEPAGKPQTHLQAGTRTPRNVTGLVPTLETVQEGDHGPESLENDKGTLVPPRKTLSETSKTAHNVPVSRDSARLQHEGGTDNSAPNEERPKVGGITRNVSAPPAEPARKKSFTTLLPSKTRGSNEGSVQVMTVETETVSSIPQTSTATSTTDRAGNNKNDSGSTLRTKPSAETVKAKKEKKKPPRKPPISGMYTTKADIFEAKVASAVDEDSSDSDETFVYESNPPESRPRQLRHHSRTPSITSMHSLVDRKGQSRGVGYHHDNNHGPLGKRSMKFASSHASSSLESDGAERNQGTVRASKHKHIPSNDVQYQHIGMFGRSQPHNLESESPYSHASRFRSAAGFVARQPLTSHSSDPDTPVRLKTPTRKGDAPPFWIDDGAADDERAPLVGSLRSQRSRNFRRPTSSNMHYVEYQDEEIPRRWFNRFTGCLFLALTIILAMLVAAGLVFVTSKPLYDVKVLSIENVLASEQEIMLDLLMGAINPSVLAISVLDLDVNLFAKSRHTATPYAIRARKNLRSTSLHYLDNVDEGTDPIDDPAGDPQTMLLGRILQFDSALIFDASPLLHRPSNSTGELRLAKPGNATGHGGIDRWKHILQFPFELIVRGIVKYQLPLASHTTSASIGASVVVHPEDDIDENGRTRLRPYCDSSECEWPNLLVSKDPLTISRYERGTSQRMFEMK